MSISEQAEQSKSVFIVTKNIWTGAYYDGYVNQTFGVFTDLKSAKKSCSEAVGAKIRWAWDKDDKTWNYTDGGSFGDIYSIKEFPLNTVLNTESVYA